MTGEQGWLAVSQGAEFPTQARAESCREGGWGEPWGWGPSFPPGQAGSRWTQGAECLLWVHPPQAREGTNGDQSKLGPERTVQAPRFGSAQLPHHESWGLLSAPPQAPWRSWGCTWCLATAPRCSATSSASSTPPTSRKYRAHSLPCPCLGVSLVGGQPPRSSL